MKYLLLVLVCLTLSSCCNILGIDCEDPVIDSGPTAELLQDGAAVQKKNTDVIETEASKIDKTTKEPETKKSAKIIIVANDELKANQALLEQASKGKEEAVAAYKLKEKELVASKKETADWKEKYEGKVSAFMIWIKGIGVLMIPIGLFLMFKVAGERIWVSVAGVCCIVTGMVVEWIEANFIWILVGIVTAAGIAGWRLWVQQRRTVYSATRANEILKHEIKALDETEVDMKTKVGTQILEKVFGEYHNDGLMSNDPTTVSYTHLTLPTILRV